MIELKRILLQDIMIIDPFTLNIDDPFSFTWDMFTTREIRHIPIINDDKTLAGIITIRDLYRIISPRKNMDDGGYFYDRETLDRYILRKVMTKDVFTLKPQDTIGKAVRVMAERKYGCVPVVDTNNRLVGIVTQIDILKTIAGYFIE
ncbi:MAG: CBS domain-containing protein [Candidatus Omnitrophica bacterium]|nr:CBS domain-containing protein [Candidatus Omnitrophota bacterium]